MYKLVIFVPSDYLEAVKNAVFDAGAGTIGNYDRCCWEVVGRGQFRALDGSNPFIGQQGEVEYVEEYRVEMVCRNERVGKVLKALKSTHPYEEPAFDIWELSDIKCEI